jgi:putative N-acetylmannosamine-6-phosphate epimerase
MTSLCSAATSSTCCTPPPTLEPSACFSSRRLRRLAAGRLHSSNGVERIVKMGATKIVVGSTDVSQR